MIQSGNWRGASDTVWNRREHVIHFGNWMVARDTVCESKRGAHDTVWEVKVEGCT